MARPRTPPRPTLLRADRLLDVDKGEYIEPGTLLVDGDRIDAVSPTTVPEDAIVIPEHCARLPLDAGAASWAEAARRLLTQRRPDREQAILAIEESPFSLSHGFESLRAIYR